jgi:hypothetical protein
MHNFQPQALTDKELVKYCDLWLDDESLPIEAQRELVKRLAARIQELDNVVHTLDKKLHNA